MTESQNLVAETQISDTSQPIGDGFDMVGAPADAIEVVKVNAVELGSGAREMVRKRRGRPSKAQAKPPPAKKNKEVVVVPEEEEDVCFICFDGGSLVLCDRKGCPKAYHPACIKRDEAFFESAAKWNCGWHICSICQKTAHHMCYTCTYSLCRGCIRKADYVCVRDKGFCTICMKTIMLIENNGQGEDGKVQADFDDKLSWEYLFKVYWVYLKGKLSLTVDELTQAKNPWKEASTITTTISPPSLPSNGVHKPISVDKLEENESKRRKIDEHIDVPIPTKETLNLENVKSEKIENATAKVVKCKEWATNELLEFISHMKNGNTSVLSRFDVQALMMEYINTNNLRDPKKKNQIICDSRLANLFKKPRVGHIQIWKLLEHHFLVKEKSRKTRVVKRTSVQDDADWTCENVLTLGKDKKRKNRSKGEERQLQNKLDDFAAVDVYNMNLIYLRRDLMENLLEDCENFHNKVVGSIVRVKILGSDLKHDMYRLVQVVGTSKVDVSYKIDKKMTDFMLEVLNLDKKETISIDNVSDQDFSEEECRRLQQSIKCGLVKHFTVGEIQEKAVALQSLKLNDWMEKETMRLTRLRDLATEKGHKKGYKECVEKLQLLKTPDERERILQQIPEVHSDRKMNPHYESDDTEEYFNKEHGDHMESKYSVVSTKKRRAPRSNNSDTKSQKDEKAPPIIETESTKSTMEKDATVSTLVNNSEHEIDCNNSTITKLDQQPTISSSVSNIPPETTTPPTTNATSSSSPNDVVWHYLDPNGRVQGPFSLLQLQRWNTTGYFPIDMRIWANHEDKTVLLTDVLKDQFDNYQSTTATVKVKVTESLNISSAVPSDAPNSSGQNWSATNNNNLNSNPKNVELNTPIEAETDNNHVSVPTPVVDLPGPKLVNEVDQIQPVPVQDSGNPPSWSSASSLVIGGPTKLPVSNEWGVKREEWVESFKQPLEIAGDLNVATPTSNIDQNVDNNNNNNINININIDNQSQSQAMCNDFTTWHGMGEMIEFSTLAEESVSDLLAEVDAMESQYGGLPSPTSRRNSFVDDLFNGSFDEFSPTPDQGTRSDGFSSSGDIQLPAQSTDEQQHLVGFDFLKTSFMASEMGQKPDGGGFKWPEMIDINRSAKGEGDEGEMEMKTSDNNSRVQDHVQVKVENGNLNLQNVDLAGQIKSNDGLFVEQMKETKSIGAKLVNRVAQIKGFDGPTNHRRPKNEEDGEFVKPQPLPPPPPPLTLGLDPFDPNDLESEGKFSHTGQSRNDPNLNLNQSQRRVNSSSSRRSSLGGSGGGGSRPPVKGRRQQQQRVCRFYENGRCKKGASCRYLHSSPSG